MSKKRLFCLVAAMLIVATPASARTLEGQEHESRVLSDSWNIVAGAFLADFDTEFAAGRLGVLSATIKLEDELSLQDDLQRGTIGGFYRFRPKHSIGVNVFVLNRSSSRAVAGSITIPDEEGDITFDVGAIVDTALDNTIAAFDYRYSFINNGKTEAGFNAGLAMFGFDVALKGIATVDDGVNPPSVEMAEGDTSILIPVPTFGFYVRHAFTPKFLIQMSANFLDLSVGDFEGEVLNTRVTVDYYFVKHFGVGGGLTRWQVDVQDTSDEPWRVGYKFGGFVGYLSFVW